MRDAIFEDLLLVAACFLLPHAALASRFSPDLDSDRAVRPSPVLTRAVLFSVTLIALTL